MQGGWPGSSLKSTGVWLVDGHVLQSLRPYGGFPRWLHGETIYLPMQELQEIRVLSLGGEDPLEEEMANVLQYSCWDNPMNRGAWGATVHGVTKSPHDWVRTQGHVALALCLGLPRISAGQRQHHTREGSKAATGGHTQGKHSGSRVHINRRQQHTAASFH